MAVRRRAAALHALWFGSQQGTMQMHLIRPGEGPAPHSAPFVVMDPDLGFVHPLPRRLVALWRARLGAGTLPARTGFDPVLMREHLGHLFLVDIEGPLIRLRWRLIGSRITSLMQRDSTGRYFDELYPAEIMSTVLETYRWVIEQQRPLRTHGRAFYPDRQMYDYETLLLPLSNDGARVDMVLGELHFALAGA